MGVVRLLFCAFMFLQSAKAERKCDALGVLIYDDMKCKPTLGSDGCPTKYDCADMIKKSTDYCYFKGESYKDQQSVNRSSMYCHGLCLCTKTDESRQFVCALSECWESKQPEGCYYQYKLDHCCGKSYCPPKDTDVFKCTYDGAEYKEGQKFYSKDSCSKCVCQKGFDGKIEEPFCAVQQCQDQLQHQENIQKACAPVYTKQIGIKNGNLCCPHFYHCPDGTEVIGGNSTSSEVCHYGDKTLRVGEEFKTDIKTFFINIRATCKCTVPPLVTCVEEKEL